MIVKTSKSETAAKDYVTVILTDEKSGHRFVETKSGQTELRFPAGKLSEINNRKFIALIRNIIRTAKSHKIEKLFWTIDPKPFIRLKGFGGDWFWQTIAENVLIANYEFHTYKTGNKKNELKEVVLAGSEASGQQSALKRGILIGEHVNQARDIANTPGDDMTPRLFGESIKKLAKGTKIKVTVFDEKQIKKEGLHALWAVGKGADDMPRFVIMEYKGGKPKEKPIVLIGKGVTYDTGGLNIKPSGGMHDMHMDMSGGSSVAAAIVAAAKLGLKKNVVALVPVAENAVSEKSMRAGDIIKSHSGKTIEVLHTDAEGRLILADAMSYANKFSPRAIIDVATLTGAAMVALGQQASAVMTTNDTLRETLPRLGEETGDYVWPLPLWDEFKKPLTETRADVVNIQPSFSKFGGAIEGAAFLSFFAPKGIPWAHLDIAPRMDAAPHDKLAKGSTGEPVRLLIKFLETY
ncbi:hypothetical protein A2392_01480 [Candidatus Kaiserbacteria bacterium RIFOXYB1_FULL_46_14]|uniref:Cytosol aminopeptidase domain-containing protein n=1 Tax=Candidatus Kaiserbacteria bacterium RIFOXYB1_FULL_46_14 TaxID=1798531 RepID=A0A1F6FJT3_9BACT|nr:MAG: hypothetical protein A2392_01480 [Candidatus Kaiserbacteria bacterium RIFOXYB1_FULL_46_14]